MLKTYLNNIFNVSSYKDDTELSYYSVLVDLLKEYAQSIDKQNTHITTLPKSTDAGNPDFRIWDGKQHIIGYIEAKKPTTENLSKIEDSEQLKRYRHTFPNLILTNFYEFRLYRNGSLIDKVTIGSPFTANTLKTAPTVENKSEFLNLFERFFSFSLPKVNTAEDLAIELAKRTRFLKDEVMLEELKEDGFILGFYEAFQTYLITGLSKTEFADLFSQTITYGLFAARTRSGNDFNRKLAYDNIPHTIGILREIFSFISKQDLPKQMEWIIDDISEVLTVTDVKNILQKYFHEGKGNDPIIHFYETFLAEYDPKTRQQKGVYYTPEPVVSYIVRSLHILLKERFNRPDGFADKGITALDPAGGTLTFLAEAARLAVNEFVTKYGVGGKPDFIKGHILENFYAFEIMMAPYAVGHLKMSFLLEELGYSLTSEDRFKMYLTNTLEMNELEHTRLPGMSSLSEESHLAGRIKREKPILVILGNPPYSVSSANRSEFIDKEMDVYKKDVQGEKNLQPLSDDYIKFIRFAHWKIDNTGAGLIGMITNNGYLSGLIHRGMRKRLLESFNEIYILNLHGNSRIGEKCPDGTKDENVFDIQQGVSIALFVKNEGSKEAGRVFYHDLFGLQDIKYEYLKENNKDTTQWTELKPVEPYYFLVKKDFTHQGEYDKFVSISEIFDAFSTGVTTHRDHFVIGFTKDEIRQRMRTFTSDLPDDLVSQGLDLQDTKDWKLKDAREKVKKIDWQNYIRECSYRPFDDRIICYLPDLMNRSRWDLMQNFFDENMGLLISRQQNKTGFYHAFVSENIADKHCIGDQSFIFPLYLYPDKNKDKLLNHNNHQERHPNIKPEFYKILEQLYNKRPDPEEILYYIYGILYSNIYRKKYAEFLKIDFPKIPFVKNLEIFDQIAGLGKRLVSLHLLKSPTLDTPITKYQGTGDNRVKEIKYHEIEKKVFINKTQFFEEIDKEVWEYQIGGYQVCCKWLKDRKDRILTLDEIKHYCRFSTSLYQTIEIQKEIDLIKIA